MAQFTIKPTEIFQSSIRVMAVCLIEEMEEQLFRTKGQHESIHRVRVSIKKMRALLHLIRPSIGEEVYGLENALFRDLARSLAFIRDHSTCLDALSALLTNRRSRQIHSGFAGLAKTVNSHRAEAMKKVDFPELSIRIQQDLQQARHRVGNWNLTIAPSEVIYEGLLMLYSQARRRFWSAKANTGEISMHQLRKTTKYLLYINQMLQDLWPSVLSIHVEEYKELSSLLGMHHDICVLNHWFPEIADKKMKKSVRISLQKAMWKRKNQLEKKILIRAARIYSERPASYAGKYRTWWNLVSG